MRIYKEFFFEAAHRQPGALPGDPTGRIHGHSFRVRVSVDGEPDPESGFVVSFDHLMDAIAGAREELDHRFLNDIPGLETPTLERIAVWLWQCLGRKIKGLSEVMVARDSCLEGCVYVGPTSDSGLG